MKLHAELEAYRDRLMERASAWAATSETDLARDLQQCEAQVALLDKGVESLRARRQDAPPEQADLMAHRLSVQEQMRDLTAAYAEVLKNHLGGRTS